MPEADDRILLDWNALEVGETFEKYEYVLTQEMIDTYRKGVMDGPGLRDESPGPAPAAQARAIQLGSRLTDMPPPEAAQESPGWMTP